MQYAGGDIYIRSKRGKTHDEHNDLIKKDGKR